MAAFRYCLNASTIRPTPLMEKIRIAGETGYSAIELWHDEIEEYCSNGGALVDIRKALIDQNLELPTTIYLRNWCDTTGQVHVAALEDCRRRLAEAAGYELGFGGGLTGQTSPLALGRVLVYGWDVGPMPWGLRRDSLGALARAAACVANRCAVGTSVMKGLGVRG